MPSSLRSFLRFALLLTAAVVIFVGGFLVYDELTLVEPTYEPVDRPSALDDWEASWPTPEEVAMEGANAEVPGSEDLASEDLASEEPAKEELTACESLPKKWMMIGWDGADWGLILPLLEKGELPNLAALMEGGTYGSLDSFVPSLSPAIWTTVVTGVSPAEHGIKRFYNKRPRLERWWSRLKNFGTLERVLYSNADRRVRALWNELSDRDKSVLMVGYHNTFPVEEVKGMMVSNYLVQDSIGDLMQMRSDGGSDSSFALSLVHPADQLLAVLDIQDAVNEGSPQALRRFVEMSDTEYRDFLRKSRTLDPKGDQRPYFLARAYGYDTMLAETALRYLPEVEPDMLFVHFQGLDWAAHQFLYFHEPELYEGMDWSAEVRTEMEGQQSAYGGTVVAFYHYMDEVLGRFLAARDSETAVILLSDHGFEADHDHLVPGFHDDGPPGILVMNGPGIRRDHRLEGASVYDILPTLMASLELPVAEDLVGRVQEDAFCAEAWAASLQTTVASYQTGERFVPAVAKPPELNQELLDQLKSLGYLK